MKKGILICIVFLTCIFMIGCKGKKGNEDGVGRGVGADLDDLSVMSEQIEYYDISVVSERLFEWEQEGEESGRLMPEPEFISMQFYQGEPVQLWREPNLDEYEFLVSWDICLYRADGSREVLLKEIKEAYNYHGYLDQEGYFYWWKNSTIVEPLGGEIEEIGAVMMKYSPTGELIFEKQYDFGIAFRDIRQTTNGRTYLILSEMGAEGDRRLAELDPVTGTVTELEAVWLPAREVSDERLGVYGDQPARFKFQGYFDHEITVINVADGSEDCIFSFAGTTYLTPKDYTLCDFKLLENGSVETLWTAWDGSKSLRQVLRREKVEKTPIILRGYISAVGWLSEQVNSFNQQSEIYHVVIDAYTGTDLDELARLTSVQIASGKGPDILCGGLMQEYIPGMLEKGALEDLRPYMERSGIREEDFFPLTFDTWRSGDKICGISPASPSLTGYCMDSSVLGGTAEPDIETLVDALLARKEDAILLKGYDSRKLLEFLLKGTETLWGMVDWEKGSCDFGGELFMKILEVAKRYGDSGNRGDIYCIARKRRFGAVPYFEDSQELEKNGKVVCGVLFDDGCHAAVESDSALAINANSSNKEGAWEFISFLLGEEVQSGDSGVPVSRKAFDIWTKRQKERLADEKLEEMIYEVLPDGTYEYMGKTIYTEADVTDEIIEEYTGMLEDTRTYPIRTVSILAIISEEAEDYFQGIKGPEEVSRLITNRVQVYLDEMQ